MPRHNYIIHMLYVQYLQEYEHEHERDYYHYLHAWGVESEYIAKYDKTQQVCFV